MQKKLLVFGIKFFNLIVKIIAIILKMGLVELEWLETLSTIDPEAVNYRDYVEVGNELAKQLKDDGCDVIIALTHMRFPNDCRLAENAQGIDLVLGGHDHVYDVKHVSVLH